MTKEEEMKRVIEWCEQRKRDAGRTPLIEINPFKDISWIRNKTVIQIDRSQTTADPRGIIYESTLKALFEYVNGIWKRIEQSR